MVSQRRLRQLEMMALEFVRELNANAGGWTPGVQISGSTSMRYPDVTQVAGYIRENITQYPTVGDRALISSRNGYQLTADLTASIPFYRARTRSGLTILRRLDWGVLEPLQRAIPNNQPIVDTRLNIARSIQDIDRLITMLS